jgi:hypothetical protein
MSVLPVEREAGNRGFANATNKSNPGAVRHL